MKINSVMFILLVSLLKKARAKAQRRKDTQEKNLEIVEFCVFSVKPLVSISFGARNPAIPAKSGDVSAVRVFINYSAPL
jgi:hypothetical protein